MVFGERVDDALHQTKCQRGICRIIDLTHPCADDRTIEEFLRLSPPFEPVRAQLKHDDQDTRICDLLQSRQRFLEMTVIQDSQMQIP